MEGKACVLVMGVSGCGKSSVALALQAKLGEEVTFLDADAFHPPENVAKMKNGIPLTDEDRWGWLSTIRSHILSLPTSDSPVKCVLACSALKKRYRDFLHDGGSSDGAKLKWKIVFLAGSFSLIEKRFEALEEPTVAAGENVLRVSLDAEQPIDVIAKMASIWVLGVQKN